MGQRIEKVVIKRLITDWNLLWTISFIKVGLFDNYEYIVYLSKERLHEDSENDQPESAEPTHFVSKSDILH